MLRSELYDVIVRAAEQLAADHLKDADHRAKRVVDDLVLLEVEGTNRDLPVTVKLRPGMAPENDRVNVSVSCAQRDVDVRPFVADVSAMTGIRP